MPIQTDIEGLPALEARIARDLDIVAYPKRDWVAPVLAPDGKVALDCAIVGAGQYGLALAFGLKREGVARIACFDRAAEGFEGPWMSFARMSMLRTPKDLTGPEFGIPSLGVRSWYEAKYGAKAWDEMFRIPRPTWMEYLRWYRHVTSAVVHNRHDCTRIEPLGDTLFKLTFATSDGDKVFYASTVVMAMGAEGSGGRTIPDFIRDTLPASLYAHTNDAIDFAKLKGKRIGILGAGASAFDNATAALEAGAASADLCFRRAQLPRQNPRRWMEYPGFLSHFASLPDAQRWAYMRRLYAIGQPPPKPTYDRAMAQPGFKLCPSTPWDKVDSPDGKTIVVTSGSRKIEYDFAIVATGLYVDIAKRPEYAALREHAALWKDRYAPPPDMADSRLGNFLYLGPNGEMSEKTPGAAPYLKRVFNITRASVMSLGPVSASNSGMKYIAPRIVAGVTRTLFLDQAEAAYRQFLNGDHDEIPNGV